MVDTIATKLSEVMLRIGNKSSAEDLELIMVALCNNHQIDLINRYTDGDFDNFTLSEKQSLSAIVRRIIIATHIPEKYWEQLYPGVSFVRKFTSKGVNYTDEEGREKELHAFRDLLRH